MRNFLRQLGDVLLGPDVKNPDESRRYVVFGWKWRDTPMWSTTVTAKNDVEAEKIGRSLGRDYWNVTSERIG
jgi:hypothetical protein